MERKIFKILLVVIFLAANLSMINSITASDPPILDYDPLVDIHVTVKIDTIRYLEFSKTYPDEYDDPTFKIKLEINDVEYDSPTWSGQKRFYDLNWQTTVDVFDSDEIVEVKIKLYNAHELCDINELPDRKDIKLHYSLKTGHWIGDDELGDPSGYGRLNGCADSLDFFENDCEIFFDIYQTDFDSDGIPFYVEKYDYNISPLISNIGEDLDNDSIPIEWEYKWGYDPNTWDDHENIDQDLDSINNYEEFLTSDYNSDPFRRDYFLEFDQMELDPDSPGELISQETIEMLTDRYNSHDIVYHFDYGSMGGGGEIIPFDECTTKNELYGLYDNYFLDNDSDNWRRSVFRWGVFTHDYTGGAAHAFIGEGALINSNVPGINSFHVTRLSAENTISNKGRGRDFIYACYIMHESGHSMGIDIFNPMGCDNINTGKPWMLGYYIYANYQSVMNYRYVHQILDYSDGSHGWKDYDDWGNLDLGRFELP